MAVKKKRLTIDMDPAFQHRLKAVAASKGVSMRGYCLAAIDRELAKDEANGMSGRQSMRSDAERFAELQEKHFGGRMLPGSSVDLIREAREIREGQVDYWA